MPAFQETVRVEGRTITFAAMHRAYLLLGSNTGDRHAFIDSAVRALLSAGCEMISRSRLWETAPWGNTDQASFLNAAICIDTGDSPEDLLRLILDIEEDQGRTRQEKWAPRTLDIDILFYDDRIIQLPDLQIPHPYLPERRFALAPVAEIAPDYIHPILQKNMRTLLTECPDKSEVTPLS